MHDDYEGSESPFEDGQEENLEANGYQIVDNVGDTNNDAADDWLALNDKIEPLAEGDNISPDELEGKATTADLQLSRIGHMPVETQIAIKAILSGEREGINVTGTHLSHRDLDAASTGFGKLIGGSPQEFARQIKIDPSQMAGDITVTTLQGDYFKETGERTVKSGIRDPRAIKTAFSMLSNTAGEYMDKGPGQQLAGHSVVEEKQERTEKEIAYTMLALNSLADLYIPEETRNSNIYASRHAQVVTGLTKRMMDTSTHAGRAENVILPMPAELNIGGLVTNASIFSSPQGNNGYQANSSPFGRLEYDMFIEGRSELQGSMSDEDRGQIEFDKFGKLRPSLRKSLFPVTRRGAQDNNEESKASMRKINRRAKKVQAGLLKYFPTMQDESAGRGRTQGFYLTEENPRSTQFEMGQADRLSAIDGLLAGGLDRGIDAGQATEIDANNESEISRALLELESTPDISGVTPTFADTDRGRYQKRQFENPSPEQGTQEWLDLRAGNVTASQAKKLLGREKSLLQLTSDVAQERLGIKEEFFQSDAMMQGNKYEDMVRRSFLSQVGKELVSEEAFFETNEDLPGLGASPDANLYNKETGEFEGLLELKYLQSKSSMDKALKTYNAQMQMQMLVTGAHQTHFYAMNAKTGEAIHHIVKADAELQGKLKDTGFRVSRDAASLDKAGVQLLNEQIKTLSTGRKVLSKNELDSEKAKDAAKADNEAKIPSTASAKDEAMTVYDPGRKHVTGVYPDGKTPSAASTMFAEEMGRAEKVEQGAKLKAAMASSAIEQPMEEAVKMHKMNEMHSQFKRQQQESEGAERSDDIEAARKEEAAAIRQATESLKRFKTAMSGAIGVLGGAGDLIAGGTDSAMEEVRLAAEVGLKVGDVRGLRLLMEKGGMDTQGIDKTILRAGELVTTYANKETGAIEYTRMRKEMGVSALSEVRNMPLHSLRVLGQLNASQQLQHMTDMMEGQRPMVKQAMAKIFGMPDAAAFERPELMGSFDDAIDELGARDTLQGVLSVEQPIRQGKEWLGSSGYLAGQVAAAGKVAAQNATVEGLKKLAVAASVAVVARTGLPGIDEADPDGRRAELTKKLESVENNSYGILEKKEKEASSGWLDSFIGQGARDSYKAKTKNHSFETTTLPTSSIGGMSQPGEESDGTVINNETTVNVTVDKDGVSTTIENNGEEYDTESRFTR